ncbi:hypothetical protein AAVH_21664 [Aphelenchoides avenae]|nr:hypothetical protein AAVH_21664 [Aphelenchus avenae]
MLGQRSSFLALTFLTLLGTSSVLGQYQYQQQQQVVQPLQSNWVNQNSWLRGYADEHTSGSIIHASGGNPYNNFLHRDQYARKYDYVKPESQTYQNSQRNVDYWGRLIRKFGLPKS